MREDELSKGIVHGEAIDAPTFHRDDQLRTGPVHGEAGGNEVRARTQQLGSLAFRALRQHEDAEDGAHGHARVQIAASVDGIAHHCVASVGILMEDDAVLLPLLRPPSDISQTYAWQRGKGRCQ